MAKRGVVAKFVKEMRSNPETAGLMSQVTHYVAPAAVGYFAGRIIGNYSKKLLESKIPTLANFVPLLSNAALFGLVYYLGGKADLIKKYKMPLLAGVGVSTIQTLIETFSGGGIGNFLNAASKATPITIKPPQPRRSGTEQISRAIDDTVLEGDEDESDDDLDEELGAMDGEEEAFEEYRSGVFDN